LLNRRIDYARESKQHHTGFLELARNEIVARGRRDGE
jgi:hypothetical protein